MDLVAKEDRDFVSEVVVLDSDSWVERDEREKEVKEERSRAQRRGGVKQKFADTLKNVASVARRSPSLHSLKRFF